MQVKAGNIRVRKDLVGGTLYDIGIYRINAARYLFRHEPSCHAYRHHPIQIRITKKGTMRFILRVTYTARYRRLGILSERWFGPSVINCAADYLPSMITDTYGR
jgi:hypothetical protein